MNAQAIDLGIHASPVCESPFFAATDRRSTAEKFRLNADPGLLQLVDELTVRREPGWLAVPDSALDRVVDEGGLRGIGALRTMLPLPTGDRGGDRGNVDA